MRKLTLWLLTLLLVFITTTGYELVNPARAIPSCNITNLTTQVGNGSVSYSQVGNGKIILLLHGLFANKEQWNPLMCRLSEAGYRTIAPDLPGYGNSKGFEIKDYALENQATLIHEFVNSLGINSFELAGNSMGGAIAYIYTQHYSNQVHSLTFIGSPMGIVDWGEGVREAILQGINPFIPITKEQFALQMHLLFVKPPIIPDSLVAEKVRNYISDNLHYQQVWNIINLYDEILLSGEITAVPTLVIWGKEDRIYDVRGANQLQQHLADSQLILLPKAGHLPQLEIVEDVGSQYLHFLQHNN